jgi:hypothetical protein
MRSSTPLSLALLCSPPSLLPFQIEQMVAESSRGRRGGGGIEQRTARRWWNRAEDSEEMAESRERQVEHKATRRRLTPKASLERPDA